jgi:ComF family protein
MDGPRWKKSSWGEKLRTLLGWICDGFYPRRCPVCDEILGPEEAEQKIHSLCVGKLRYVTGATCMQCGRPLDNEVREYCYDCQRLWRQNIEFMPQSKHAWREITRATEATTQISQGKAIYLYQGPIKETMYRFKYSNKREYAEFFAEEAVRIYGDWMKRKNIQAIVPVPMYMPKQRRRGYNQAETFAKALGRKMNIPVDATLVKRVKDTKPQKELNDLERKNNLKNAFQKTESIVQYSHILVVDDIYTTGSTAMAVAEQLRKTNTCQVYFLSICIGKGM